MDKGTSRGNPRYTVMYLHPAKRAWFELTQGFNTYAEASRESARLTRSGRSAIVRTHVR